MHDIVKTTAEKVGFFALLEAYNLNYSNPT